MLSQWLPNVSSVPRQKLSVSSGVSRSSVLSMVPAAQAITLLASQIPSYGGTEEENVEFWLNKVDRVSRVHGISDDVTLLAATNKLTKLARQLFDVDTGTISSLFKQALTRFRRRLPSQVILQRVERESRTLPRKPFKNMRFTNLHFCRT
jgi:hypothetical protein